MLSVHQGFKTDGFHIGAKNQGFQVIVVSKGGGRDFFHPCGNGQGLRLIVLGAGNQIFAVLRIDDSVNGLQVGTIGCHNNFLKALATVGDIGVADVSTLAVFIISKIKGSGQINGFQVFAACKGLSGHIVGVCGDAPNTFTDGNGLDKFLAV